GDVSRIDLFRPRLYTPPDAVIPLTFSFSTAINAHSFTIPDVSLCNPSDRRFATVRYAFATFLICLRRFFDPRFVRVSLRCSFAIFSAPLFRGRGFGIKVDPPSWSARVASFSQPQSTPIARVPLPSSFRTPSSY